MEIEGLEIKKGLVYQEINLEKLFGVDVSMHTSLKVRFAQACIDAVVERCQKGLDFRGKKLPPYSESYVESDVFKAYGKDKNTPNEKLKGDMLASMDVLKNEGNKIQFGWNDPEQAEKARGHITGYQGHPFLKGKPAREFFGLTQSQLDGIALTFESEVKALRETSRDDKSSKSEGQKVLEYFSEFEAKNESVKIAKLLGIGFEDGERN